MKGQHSFARKRWTPEEDQLIREWCEGKRSASLTRQMLHVHHYYLLNRAIELGLELPRTRQRAPKFIRPNIESRGKFDKNFYDGIPYACTVRNDPLLSRLQAGLR